MIQDLFTQSIRPLQEIKGLVVSDYQSFLEQEWLKELKAKYTITINQELFALAKSQKIDYNVSRQESSNQFICDSFSSCFHQAGRKLGYSKNVYFGWNGGLYTTERKP